MRSHLLTLSNGTLSSFSPRPDWQEKDCDEDLSIWEDNWDDDDVEDDFSEQLK